jgi:hypothetical protein
MNKASKEMGDEIVTKSGHTVHEKCRRTGNEIVTKSGHTVHEKCRRTYINPIVIKGLMRKPSEPVNEQPLLRSEKKRL